MSGDTVGFGRFIFRPELWCLTLDEAVPVHLHQQG
jgi:hypothetical protein